MKTSFCLINKLNKSYSLFDIIIFSIGLLINSQPIIIFPSRLFYCCYVFEYSFFMYTKGKSFLRNLFICYFLSIHLSAKALI